MRRGNGLAQPEARPTGSLAIGAICLGKTVDRSDETWARGSDKSSFSRAGYASASMSARISLLTNKADTGIRRCPPTTSSPPVCT